jgi:hypothetical protein
MTMTSALSMTLSSRSSTKARPASSLKAGMRIEYSAPAGFSLMSPSYSVQAWTIRPIAPSRHTACDALLLRHVHGR